MSAKFTFINRQRKVINRSKLDEYISKYLTAKKLEKRSDRTIKTYEQTLLAFKKWAEENNIEEINNDVMRDFIHYLTFDKEKWDDHPISPTKEKGLSPTSINNTIRYLKAFFNWLISERILSQNPMDGIKFQKEDSDTFEIFTDEDVIKLLEQPNRRVYTGFRDYVMMLVLLDTGVRIGELTSLRVRDVDFSLRQIVLPASITKGNRLRVVPISKKCADAIKQLIEYINVSADDYLFLTQFGERYYADTFAKMLKKYGKKAGIKSARCSPHTFRHYFAVKYLRSKGDPFSLMRILGHTDMQMTQRYVKYTNMDIHDAHDKASPVMNLLDKGNERKRGKVLYK